jgi:monolysocardiolipin acyltransferase
MTSRFRSTLSKNKLVLSLGFGSLGATYWYYKTPSNPAPTIPYIPPPFVWSSIPTSIRTRFSVPPQPLENGFVWNVFSTAVVGGAGVLAKGFLNASQTKVHGLEQFLKIVQDPHRAKGLITGKWEQERKEGRKRKGD